jgi:hypothetical protein
MIIYLYYQAKFRIANIYVTELVLYLTMLQTNFASVSKIVIILHIINKNTSSNDLRTKILIDLLIGPDRESMLKLPEFYEHIYKYTSDPYLASYILLTDICNFCKTDIIVLGQVYQVYFPK